MAYQSEAQLENELIEQLEKQGYERLKISVENSKYNRHKQIIEDTLKQNLREQLFELNKKRLNNEPFTDKEFERILIEIEGKSIFRSAKFIRDDAINLNRDNGERVYVYLFDQNNLSNNKLQVVNQVNIENTQIVQYEKGKFEKYRKNRYDVTILMNGLPIVQIELKKRGGDYKEAFNQIIRYKRETIDKGIFRYIQIFVISDGVDTKYFANSDKEILFSNTFYWSDEKNRRISKINEFAETFLNKKFLLEVLSKYMIINENDKIMMVMRPYQIYAVKAIIKQALETDKNGYVWHTTGSGKTLTSFKTSQLLCKESKIKKVFFLLDRKDLDMQTISEFNKFTAESVDRSENTKKLVEQISDISKNLIVTTIQKMSKAIKDSKYSNIMDKYKNEKVVFIIDECHRSQFGEMNKRIKEHFTKAQYFGFTGTPRFKENKSQDGRTTADLFDKCLHTYMIKDAINDGNVLGFNIEYVKTFDGEYDEYDETEVEAINTKEVFESDERIENIAKNIFSIHNNKTYKREYTAILATQSVEVLLKYYEKFKDLNETREEKDKFKIAAIYTYEQNEESEGKTEWAKDSLEKIMYDYGKVFDTNYSLSDYNAYYLDVTKRVKKGEIDILIVVDMFLTGFDSKKLNTLYIDKELKYHTLLQAYSRTNRVEKTKKNFGNIVCYRNLKKRTDDAIKLFSQTDKTDIVLMKKYKEYVKDWKDILSILKNLAPTPESADLLEIEEDKKKFVVAFRELTKVLTSLKTFIEFKFDEKELGISEQDYMDYKSKYFNIYHETKGKEKTKVSILDDINFEIELMYSNKINVGYIKNLLSKIDLKDNKKRERDIEEILNLVDESSNEELKYKKDLIRGFLKRVVPKLSEDADIDYEYNEYLAKERTNELYNLSKETELEENFINEAMSEYEYCGIIDKKHIKSKYTEMKIPFKERREKTESSFKKIKGYINKFFESYN